MDRHTQTCVDLATADVRREIDRADKLFPELDVTNTDQDFLRHSLTYIGRATDSYRNPEPDRRAMLVKAACLLIRAAAYLDR